MPLPKPTAIGTLQLIAVIGAAFATAMKRTLKRPMAPVRRPARALWSPARAVPSTEPDSAGWKLMDGSLRRAWRTQRARAAGAG